MSKKLIVMVEDFPETVEGYVKKKESRAGYSLEPLRERFLKVCGNSLCNYEFLFFQFWWDAYKTLKDCCHDYSDILFILDVRGETSESSLSTLEAEKREKWILEQFKTSGLSENHIDDFPSDLIPFAEGMAFLIWIYCIGKIENVMLMSEVVSPGTLSYIWRMKKYSEHVAVKKARAFLGGSNSFTKSINVNDNTINEDIKKFQRRFCSHCLNSNTIADLDFIQWQELKSICTAEKGWEKSNHPHHAKNSESHQKYIRERIESDEGVKKIYEDIGYDLNKDIGGEIDNIEKTPVWILLDDSSKGSTYDYFKSLFDWNCWTFAKESLVVDGNEFWKTKFAKLHMNLSQRYLWFNYIGLIKSMFRLEESNRDHSSDYKFTDAEFIEVYSENPRDIFGLYIKLYEREKADINGVIFNPHFPSNLDRVGGDQTVAPYRKYIDDRNRKNMYCVARFVEDIFRFGAAWFCYFALQENVGGKRRYGHKLFSSNYKRNGQDREDPFVNITDHFLMDSDITDENYDLPTFSFFIPARKFKTNYHDDAADVFTFVVGESDVILNDEPGINQKIRGYIMRTDLAGVFFNRIKD